MLRSFQGILILALGLCYSLNLHAHGAESSGSAPMRPLVPTEAFEYQCKLSFIADAPAELPPDEPERATVVFNNQRMAVNLRDSELDPTIARPPWHLGGGKHPRMKSPPTPLMAPVISPIPLRPLG